MPEATPKAREYGFYWIRLSGRSKWEPAEYCLLRHDMPGWADVPKWVMFGGLLNESTIAEIGPRAYSPDEAEENWVASRCALIAETLPRAEQSNIAGFWMGTKIAEAIRREFKLTEELPK